VIDARDARCFALMHFPQLSCHFFAFGSRSVFKSGEFCFPTAAFKPAIGENTMNIKQIVSALVSDESGQDLVEYALVVALIALGSIASMKTLTSAISSLFTQVGTNLTNAVA